MHRFLANFSLTLYEVGTVLHELLRNQYFTLGVLVTAWIFKSLILLAGVMYYPKTSRYQRNALRCLIVFLVCLLVNDITNVLQYLFRIVFEIPLSNPLPEFTLFCRFGWSLYVTQCQSIALLFEYLLNKRIRMAKVVVAFQVIMNLALSLPYWFNGYMWYGMSTADPAILAYELNQVQRIQFFVLFFVFLPFIHRLFKPKEKHLPTILERHTWVLAPFLLLFIIAEMIQNASPESPIAWYIPTIGYRWHNVLSVTTILSCLAIYIVMQKMLGLRFLNVRKVVESRQKFNFLSQFRDILEQLSYATALKELAHLTQTFFQTAFGIPLGRVRLYIRKTDVQEDSLVYYDMVNAAARVEQYIGPKESNAILVELRKSKIFVRDDVHFTAFSEESETHEQMLEFLEQINADVFLPVFERNDISAYIIVERNARPQQLYTNKDRDEMLVFTTYLSNIINILKYSNLEALHQRHKLLTEELYSKHQEINQYKESIRSFMRTNKERNVGILFYKHRRFTIANEAARELIGMDPNMNEGHQLTQAMRTLARRVQEYKTSQTAFSIDSKGKKIIINGIPSIEERSTILLIHYPEVSDVIKSHFDHLKDPSQWDYVLYLETTESGRLINELIPGKSEDVLGYKLQLLATALSKKATMLQLPEEDLMPTVEVLHDISLRKTLHTITLSAEEELDEVATKLFGYNPLIKDEPALLEKLDGTGTLFIKNIENLGKQTQDYLAEFISLGYFHKFKSEHKIFANVRIICSTNKNLLQLVNEDAFSARLYKELEHSSLSMKPLRELSESAVSDLAQGYADQIVTDDTYKNLLNLSDKDRSYLCQERPLSLQELKERVHHLLVQKSSKHKISEVTKFDPAYNVTDPDIAQAVRLGKKALKDPQIMAMLWHKFKNQSKIATLLGVNRSSVNRRCQEFNLK